MTSKREIYYFKHYFKEFYFKQDPAVRKKIDWIISLIRGLDVVPSKFLKRIVGSDGIYEIRIRAHGNIYRIFCFFDASNMIIVLNGFQKKTQKVPRNEIHKAEKLKKEYYGKKS